MRYVLLEIALHILATINSKKGEVPTWFCYLLMHSKSKCINFGLKYTWFYPYTVTVCVFKHSGWFWVHSCTNEETFNKWHSTLIKTVNPTDSTNAVKKYLPLVFLRLCITIQNVFFFGFIIIYLGGQFYNFL